VLRYIILNFLNYCKHYLFSKSTIEAFTTRLNELEWFIQLHQIKSLDEITYQHLTEFVTSDNPSVHVKKVRVWTLHQFFHYLELKDTGQIQYHDLVQRHLSYPQTQLCQSPERRRCGYYGSSHFFQILTAKIQCREAGYV
jgi:site-specific recombinase XerD